MKVTIRINDVNDNPPVFAEPVFNTGVPENVPPGAVVDFVMATDADFGVNANFTYTKSSGDPDGNFLTMQKMPVCVKHSIQAKN